MKTITTRQFEEARESGKGFLLVNVLPKETTLYFDLDSRGTKGTACFIFKVHNNEVASEQ